MKGTRDNPFVRPSQRRDTNSMLSLPKQVSMEKRVQNLKQGIITDNSSVGGTNFRQQKFLWKIQEVVDPADISLAVQFNIQTLAGQKHRYLELQAMQTKLVDYASSQFPGTINLTCVNLDGFDDNNGVATHVISTAFANIAAATYKGNNITSYNVQYKSAAGGQLWDITGIPSMAIRLQTGPGQAVNMPIQNAVYVKGKIVRVIM